MKQYVFLATGPSGSRDQIRCTARFEEWARLQVQAAYPGWHIAPMATYVFDPHHILGEIDASDMTAADADWLARQLPERQRAAEEAEFYRRHPDAADRRADAISDTFYP